MNGKNMIRKKDNTLVAGIDVGSLYTKVVVMKNNREELANHCMRSGTNHFGAAETAMNKVLALAGLEMNDISNIVATGYGRANVTFAKNNVSEITCHARGINHLLPEARTIIDIGGQDSKVIRLDDSGRVSNFAMNDKCAAGTGRFLEVMAYALEVDFEKMSALAFKSKNKLSVSSMCTVFAESEVISLIAGGNQKEDISAALFRSISGRIMGLIGQMGIKEKVAMSGGVAKSKAIVLAMEEVLATNLLIPPEPQIVGALGAAIVAGEQILDEN
ncbi:acyl-CoA dehydratase activase [Thermodesulfobacteriota bacterium]